MSRKLNFIPTIKDYDHIRGLMAEDLRYRLAERHHRTNWGRPLYYRINVQLIMTQECPFICPFCLERKNPMKGEQDFPAQLASLVEVLSQHPGARLSVTGGEPGLYPEQVHRIARIYRAISDNTFLSVNTAGIDPTLTEFAHVNLSWNDYVQTDASLFPGCTLQTVLDDEHMTLDHVRTFIESHPEAQGFSFRFLSGLERHDYPVNIWNELERDPDFTVGTFRVGDFFAYATFDYKGVHGRITLGDMYQQKHNDYQDGYSNVIIHPDGHVAVNWT